jgi:hypothetical protein
MNFLKYFQSFESVGTYVYQNKNNTSDVPKERAPFLKNNLNKEKELEKNVQVFKNVASSLVIENKHIKGFLKKEKKDRKASESHMAISSYKELFEYYLSEDFRENKKFNEVLDEELGYESEEKTWFERGYKEISEWVDGADQEEIENLTQGNEFKELENSIWELESVSEENMDPQRKKILKDRVDGFMKKHLGELNLSSAEKDGFLQNLRMLIITKNGFEKVSSMATILEESNDINVLGGKISEEFKKNEELSQFVSVYTREQFRISTFSKTNESYFESFESTIITNSPNIKEQATNVSAQLQSLGPKINIFNTRLDTNGNYQIFFNENQVGIGNQAYVVGITPDGRAYIEGDSSEKIPFDPKDPEGFQKSHEALRFYQIASFSADKYHERDNFSEFMSTDMTLKLIQSFKSYNHSFQSPEKLFLAMCEKLVDKEPAKSMGLGRYFREELFGNGSYLDRDKLLAIETETIQSLDEAKSMRPIQEMLA